MFPSSFVPFGVSCALFPAFDLRVTYCFFRVHVLQKLAGIGHAPTSDELGKDAIRAKHSSQPQSYASPGSTAEGSELSCGML